MDDMIYRQNAINVLHVCLPGIPLKRLNEILSAVPSAQPNPSQCWGCNCPKMDTRPENKELSYWKADFKEYVDALYMARDDYRGIMEYIDAVEKLSSAQPERKPCTTRRVVKNSGSTNWYECLRCGTAVDLVDKFCRGCGRRFEEGT